MNKRRESIAEVTGLKGVAILFILLFRCFWFPYMLDLIQPASPGGADYWLQGVLGAGWIGIDLFIILAGYWTTRELLSPATLGNFYARRARRVLPGYALLIVFGLSLYLLYPPEFRPGMDPIGLGSLWTFTSNLLIAQDWRAVPVPFQHLWSIALLIQFYLLWPLVVRGCGPRGRRAAFLLLIVACPIARLLLLHEDMGWKAAALVLTPLRLDSFAWGGLLTLTKSDIQSTRRWWKVGAWLSFAGLVAFFIVRPGFNFLDPWVLEGGLSLLALFFTSTLAVVLSGKRVGAGDGWMSSFLQHPLLRSFGHYSYGVYLFHQPVIALLCLRAYLPGPGWSPYLVFFLLSSGVSMFLAILSYHLWERRFL